MRTTDDPGLVLDVLTNILENGEPIEGGKIKYELGSIAGLSDLAEQTILKHLQNNKVLSIEKINQAGSVGYSQSAVIESIMPMNLPGEPEPTVTISVNRPGFATLKFKREIILKEISKYQKVLISGKNIQNRAITKDSNGDFRYFRELITIGGKPLDHDTLHFKILNILLCKSDIEGKVSLEQMERELIKLDTIIGSDTRTTKEAIDDAITNFFRRAKVNEKLLGRKLPDKRRIIDTYHKGRRFAGWKLNNPEV